MQYSIREFNSIFYRLVPFFRPMRLPVCFYFAVKHQPLNACWTALFIQIAPEPPPAFIWHLLATMSSSCCVAGLDLNFYLQRIYSGEGLVRRPSMRNCRGMLPFFDTEVFYAAELNVKSAAPQRTCSLPPVPRPGDNLLPCDEYEPPDGQELWQLLLRLWYW